MDLDQIRWLRNLRSAAWPILQAAVAAGIAWFLASQLLGHLQPVFAPTAAVVSLAAHVGGRGRQAVRMLMGVGIGVGVGAVLVLVIGVGPVQVSLAALLAMLAAAVLLYSPLPLIQAGGSAVLIVALQTPESGGERILDALIGGGVALVFSQVLFAPSPTRMLTQATRRTLEGFEEELQALADALDEADVQAAKDAVDRLRTDGLSSVTDLASARRAARNIARRTVRGRWESIRVERLRSRVEQVDLLFEDALLVGRAVHELLDRDSEAPPWLHRSVAGLARAIGELARDPASSQAAQAARGRARKAAEAGRGDGPQTAPGAVLAAEAVQLLATDIERTIAAETERTGGE